MSYSCSWTFQSFDAYEREIYQECYITLLSHIEGPKITVDYPYTSHTPVVKFNDFDCIIIKCYDSGYLGRKLDEWTFEGARVERVITTDHEIRELAYKKWEQSNRPHGCDGLFWNASVEELNRRIRFSYDRLINGKRDVKPYRLLSDDWE